MSEKAQLAFLATTLVAGVGLVSHGYVRYLSEPTTANMLIGGLGSLLIILNIVETQTEAFSRRFNHD